jgi:Protein of unknown function (DUF2721)
MWSSKACAKERVSGCSNDRWCRRGYGFRSKPQPRKSRRNAIGDDAGRAHLKADLPRLKQRAVLLNSAILFASFRAIVATLLVVVAFVIAFFGIEHERGIAVLFILTLGLFAASLVNFVRETRIALHESDYC